MLRNDQTQRINVHINETLEDFLNEAENRTNEIKLELINNYANVIQNDIERLTNCFNVMNEILKD